MIIFFYFYLLQCTFESMGHVHMPRERQGHFFFYIVLVYAKGLHLDSGPLCHDVFHSISHIKIKLHFTYSELYKSSITMIMSSDSPNHLRLAFRHYPTVLINFLWLST